MKSEQGRTANESPLAAAPRTKQSAFSSGLVQSYRSALGIACLASLTLALFWRAALLRGYLVPGDIIFFFEPAKALLHDSLRAGRLPLWSPWIFAGYPIAAEGQIAAFYPVSLLLSWLLPSFGAVNWLVILHVMLAGVSLFLLARLLGASPFGAWLAGLTYSFSGFQLTHVDDLSLLCAASWMPLVVYFIERAWRGRLLPNAVLAAVCWASAALCGHPQMLFYISLVALFWVAWRWRASLPTQGRMAHGRAVCLLALAFSLGPALAAVQLLPTAVLSGISPHGEKGSLFYVTSFSLSAGHLIGLLWPERARLLYIGLIPLGLAVLGGARRSGWPLAGLAVAALTLAMAANDPLYQVLRFLPGFSYFRAPARYVSIFAFAASLLAASGWRVIANGRWLHVGRRLPALGMVVAALAGFDLLREAKALTPLADPAVLERPSPVAEALRNDKTWWRAMIVPPPAFDVTWTPRGGFYGDQNGWAQARTSLLADAPQSYHIPIPDGYAGFQDSDYRLLLKTAHVLAQAGDLRLLSLLGVKYVVVAERNLAGLKGVRVGQSLIFRNPGAFPRAFTVPQTIPVRDARQAHIQTVQLARTGRLRQAAAVRGESAPLRSSPSARSHLTVFEPRPERIAIRAESDHDCLLVLNEHCDSGWRVRVDGRPSPLLEVDLMLMGTPLPKGSHQVEFAYQPSAFLIGRAISLTALALAMTLLAIPALLSGRGRTAHN